jgi:threonine/homoserine/homoserine lactone efflux protein
MTESLITISILGFIAGFLFSMPIAGPISILITSNALKGKLRYCNLLALGASFPDFLYVFISVYGITNLFSAYKALIPYILGVGAFFIIYVGYKITRTKIDIEHIDEDSHLTDKIRNKVKGAFYTGFMINFLNPTLFFGWLASSFIVLSFAASLGFNTSGLNSMVDKNINQIEKIEGNTPAIPQIPSYLQFDTLKILKKSISEQKSDKVIKRNHLLVSIFYAAFLSSGSIVWYLILTLILVRFRKQIKVQNINLIIRSLGIVLCLIGIFFIYSAVKLLI